MLSGLWLSVRDLGDPGQLRLLMCILRCPTPQILLGFHTSITRSPAYFNWLGVSDAGLTLMSVVTNGTKAQRVGVMMALPLATCKLDELAAAMLESSPWSCGCRGYSGLHSSSTI